MKSTEDEKPQLTPEENSQLITRDKELISKMFAGDKEAGREFYDRYHRLIKLLANRAMDSNELGDLVGFDDYDQMMFEEILRNAKHYISDDHTPNQPFVAYINDEFLVPTVRNEAFNARHSVRLPITRVGQVRKMNAINNYRRFNNLPLMDDDEISKEMGFKTGDGAFTAVDLKKAAFIAQHIGSLDRGWSPGRDDDRGNGYVLDEITPLESLTTEVKTLDENIEQEGVNKAVAAILNGNVLSSLEERVIRMRFGLDSGSSAYATLDQVGDKIGISRERCRQIESKALTKIRLHLAREYRQNARRYSEDSKNYATRETREKRSDGTVDVHRDRVLREYNDRGPANYL